MRLAWLLLALLLGAGCAGPGAAPRAATSRTATAEVPDAAAPTAAPVAAPAPASVGSAAPPAPAAPCTAEVDVHLHPPPGLPRLGPVVDLDVARWRDETVGELVVRVPGKLFKRVDGTSRSELWSELFVDAPHGLTEPGGETRHFFRVLIVLADEGPDMALCRAAPYLYESYHPDGRTPQRGDPIQVAGHPAWSYATGAHGYDEQHVIVELGGRRTATLSFFTIGSYLSPAVSARLQPVFNQQGDIIEHLLASLRITRR